MNWNARWCAAAAWCLALSVASAHAVDDVSPLSLWYVKPAEKWVEALPVGNGRMGAMVFGGVGEERIQFNESTLWLGGPHDYSHPGAEKNLARIRELLFAGDQAAAQRLAMDTFMSEPLHQTRYQPFGDLTLEFAQGTAATDYLRKLDLDTATVSTDFTIGDVRFHREVYASYPDQLVVVRLAASKPGALSFTAKLTSPHEQSKTVALDDATLALRGRPGDCTYEKSSDPPMPSVLHFESRLRAATEGGQVHTSDEALVVEKANAVTLLLSAATSYTKFEDVSGDPSARWENALSGVATKSPDDLYRAHLQDYQALFRRVSLKLDGPPSALPTDERIRQCAQNPDPGLEALLFQYGRYLLIACSRPGGQPANLQGIWNDQLSPPWDSKYTININTEMNYWPAEPANLAECQIPLFDALDELAVSGARVAREHYGARGWVVHHNFDLWRGAAPINHSDHGLWPMGAAWLCQNLWWHYEFSGDQDFLRERAYPLLKGAALFFTDYLIPDPRDGNHWLISGPSNSPEEGGLVMGPTMDHQIIRELLDNAIASAKVLGVDEDLQATWMGIRARIAPNHIGQYGQLQEWLEDKDNPKNEHRHVSHLWGLAPGREISEATPDLYKAARQSLCFRGDGGTGWSMAWKVNLWARLRDGDHAHKMLGNMLSLVEGGEKNYQHGGIYPNLFDAHPPFQIDGNFGATAGMVEMLLQSQAGCVDLLPALPSVWPSGRVEGLRARGGMTVNIEWADGKLLRAAIRASHDASGIARYGETRLPFDLKGGETWEWPASKG